MRVQFSDKHILVRLLKTDKLSFFINFTEKSTLDPNCSMLIILKILKYNSFHKIVTYIV